MNPFMSVQGDTLLIGARFIRDLPVLLLNEFRVQRERKRNKERERERCTSSDSDTVTVHEKTKEITKKKQTD